MISTGNDIVSLKAINPQRTKQAQFYSKIISPSELELYRTEGFAEIPFENFVWLLWSIKESVYKFQKRNFHDLKFSPLKIIIQKINFPPGKSVTKFESLQYERDSFYKKEFHSGNVCSGNDILYFRSIIHEELLSTVVSNDEKFENTWLGIKSIDNNDYEIQSKEVRSFLLNKLSAIFPNDNFSIRKSIIGYPVLFREKEEINIPVSLAHHDHFVGYSFLLKNFI